MKLIDLHTHSLKSDGAQTPAEVVRTAYAAGLSAIALSDHDNIEGVPEAMAEGQRLGIEVIPAVELSAQSDTELHILGYFIDIHNKRLNDAMAYALEVRDHTRMAEDVWKRADEDSLRGLFLRQLRAGWDGASDEEKETITQAARFGLAALDHRDLE